MVAIPVGTAAYLPGCHFFKLEAVADVLALAKSWRRHGVMSAAHQGQQ